MRSIITLAFLFVIGLSSLFAQGKCRYELNDVDKFSNDVLRLTRSAVIWRDFYEESFVKCAAVQKNEDRGLLFVNHATKEYQVEKGDSLLLLLSDKSIMTLYAAEKRVSSYFSSKIQAAKVYYPLESKEYNQLLSTKVTTVRQYHSDGYFEYDIKDKKQNVITDIMGCISKEISSR